MDPWAGTTKVLPSQHPGSGKLWSCHHFQQSCQLIQGFAALQCRSVGEEAVLSAVSSVSPSLPRSKESAHQMAHLAIEAVLTIAQLLRTVMCASVRSAHVRQHSGTLRLRICASALVMAFRHVHGRRCIQSSACCRLNMRDVRHRTG